MKNFIVYRSSAGSGKTYTLAVNYISLAIGGVLFKKDYYKKILAITFTNKAAKEMKERVLHYLYNLSQKNDIDNILHAIKLQTNLTEKLIFDFSKSLYNNIIHNYSDLGIQTIDKFTYKIVKSFSRDLGVNNDFELELDSQKIIQPVVTLLLNKVSDKNTSLSNVLVDFTMQKIDEGNSNNIQQDLEAFCNHFFFEGSEEKLIKNLFSINESSEIKNKLFDKRKTSQNDIVKLQKEVISFFTKNNLTSNHFIRGTYYKLFSEKLLSINYLDWIPSDSLLNNINDNNWYKKNLDSNLKLEVDRCKEELTIYIDRLIKSLKDYITYTSILKKIYPSIIINELFNEITNYKKDNNIENISSFNRKIHSLVTTQVSSFIFERIGERYNHFLIDEFQDTSLLQWQNLLPLITDSLDYGKSIVVGDGKQSIYRWRSGEVEQFLKLPEIFKGDHLNYLSDWQSKLSNHYKVENLLENYRSRKNIIEFNNNLFSSVKAILSSDLVSIYDNSQQKHSYAKEGGYVNITLFDGDDYKDQILEKIIVEINEIISDQNYSYSDIAILCNTHKEIESIADCLSKNNIPLVSNEGLLISKSAKVKLVIALIKYLNNNEDEVVKATILTNIHQQRSLKSPISELYKKINVEQSFVQVLKELNIFLDIEKLMQLSLYEMIDELVDCLDLFRDIYIDFFMDLVHSFSQKNLNSIYDFLEYWEEIKNKKSIVISEEINAVKLMTIHKSKGLAFPIVIIPFDWQSSAKKDMWVENSSKISNKLKYSLINQNKTLLNSHFDLQYKRELSLNTLDNLNKLYVACTRSIDSLYIFSTSKKKASTNNFNINSFLSTFTNSYPYEFGDKIKKEKKTHKTKNVFYKEEILRNDWRKIISLRNSSSEFWDLENPKEKKDWGKLLHFALSKIYYVHQKEEVIEDLYRKGICNANEKNSLEKELSYLFSLDEINYFFTSDWLIKTEKEILLPNGKTYIPDRILFKNNEVVVLDYKTGKIDVSHKEQIMRYSNVLAEMGYTNINLFLIYTKLKNKVLKV